MSSGPSKQELEMYWSGSRQYFDELARHYQQADPAYYKEFIQPFYSNPFRAGSSGKSSTGGGGAKVFAVAVLFLVIGIAASVFIFVGKDTSSVEDKPNTVETKPEKHSLEPPVEIEPEVSPEVSIHYRRGLNLFAQKEYRLAEKYLEKVPATDPNYDHAQKMLTEIRNKKTNDNRKKPIERTR